MDNPKLMKMPNYSKKKLKDGMIKESNSGNSKLENTFFCTTRFRFFVGKLLSKWEGPYIIEEVYRSGAIEINDVEGTNRRWSMDKELSTIFQVHLLILKLTLSKP